MKKHLFSAVAVLAFAIGTAQDYTIKSNLKIDGLPAEYAAMAEQEITTYIKGEKSKTEMVGMMGTQLVYADANKMTTLMDNMGQKMGWTATKAEMEAMEKEKPSKAPEIKYFDEKKVIAGYECSKAILASSEGNVVIWYTDKIKNNNSLANKARGKNSMDLSSLKGYPLSMEISSNANGMEMKINMSASEVLTNNVDDSIFVPNTEGYKMLSYKEAMEMQKNMGR